MSPAEDAQQLVARPYGRKRTVLFRFPCGGSESVYLSWQNNDFETIKKILVIGLGSMGLGIAESLLRSGYKVYGQDKSSSQIEKFKKMREDANVPEDFLTFSLCNSSNMS